MNSEISNGSLKRQFGATTAVLTLVGQVIAVGIFLTPAGMAKSVVSPAWLLGIWVGVGLMTLCGALCYGELASRFPQAGGTYVYLREAFGDVFAFLYGWTVLFVLDPGLTAIFGVGIAAYTSYFTPLTPTQKIVIALGSILVIGIINVIGSRIGAGFLRGLTVLKVGSLLFIIVFGFATGNGNFSNMSPFFARPPDIFDALAGGIVGAFFAFAGWWEVTRIAGEIRDPTRNVPRALLIGVSMLTILYVLTSAVFMYLVPVSSVTSDETFAAQAGEALFGRAGGFVFASIVIVSLLGTLFAYMMVSPRVYYAMARDGLFFERFGRLHPRFGTPYQAIYIQILIAGLLVLTGTFDQIVSYFFFVVVVFISLSVVGLFRLHHGEFNGYKTLLYPGPPIVFLALALVVLFFVALHSPINALAGVIVMSVGIPIYYFFFRRRRR